MIDGQNDFDSPVKNDIRTLNNNIRKITTGQGDDYTTGCFLDYWLFLDYPYFKEHYNLIAINLNKQKALDANPKVIQQFNFTGNLDRAGNTTMFFIIEKPKETILVILIRIFESIVNLFCFNIRSM